MESGKIEDRPDIQQEDHDFKKLHRLPRGKRHRFRIDIIVQRQAVRNPGRGLCWPRHLFPLSPLAHQLS